jgi:hypothetical protein
VAGSLPRGDDGISSPRKGREKAKRIRYSGEPDDDRKGAPAMTSNPRWKQRPPGSTWGDFGADDQLGRLNLLTPEKVLKGVAEVKEGRTFCLSLPLDYPGGAVVNPRRHPPRLIANKRNGMPTSPTRSPARTRN